VEITSLHAQAIWVPLNISSPNRKPPSKTGEPC